MDISVIVCTRNNAARLKKTLDHIAACAVPANSTWELVLVGHNCHDETADIAQAMKSALPIKYVPEKNGGLSCARNSGIASASGSLLIFTDDDVKPDPCWVEVYWQAFNISPTGRFWGGPIRSDFEGYEPDWNIVKFGPCSIKGLDLGQHAKSLTDKAPFVSANWACPRRAIQTVGGFNPDLGLNAGGSNPNIGEETDIMNRLFNAGYEAWWLPNAALRHYVPKEKVSLAHIARRHRAAGQYAARELAMAQPLPFLRIPRWVLRTVVIEWARWILAKMTLKDGVAEFLNMQRSLGLAEAFRWRAQAERIRSQANE